MKERNNQIVRTKAKLKPIQVVIDACDIEKSKRDDFIKSSLAHCSQAELVDLVNELLGASISFTEACDETMWLHLMNEGLHPRSIEKLNMPTFKGALQGLELDKLASNKSKLCQTCAYRTGTLGNCSESTQSNVEYSIYSGSIFYCHTDSEKGTTRKNKACQGYAQHLKQLGVKW